MSKATEVAETVQPAEMVMLTGIVVVAVPAAMAGLCTSAADIIKPAYILGWVEHARAYGAGGSATPVGPRAIQF